MPPVVDSMYELPDPRAAGAAWTGGQYSVMRAIFGAWLITSFARLLPWDPAWFERVAAVAQGGPPPRHSLYDVLPNLFANNATPAFVTSVLVAGILASLCFAVGFKDRIAAAVIVYLWVCLVARSEKPEALAAASLPTPGVPGVLLLLLAHLTIPRRPYLSLDARGRPDPDGGWRLPLPVFQLAWAVLVILDLVGAFEKLSSMEWRDGSALKVPGLAWFVLIVQCAFPLAILGKKTRGYAWCAGLVVALLLAALGRHAPTDPDHAKALVVASLFAFDPGWLAPLRAKTREHVFFDGSCGLCHRFVRFVAAEDRKHAFYFSPLAGEKIRSFASDEERARLPDSVVVRTETGAWLMKSEAVIHVCEHIGGLWRAAAAVLRLIPRPLRDFGYDVVARVRHSLFARPAAACPFLSARLRVRFLP